MFQECCQIRVTQSVAGMVLSRARQFLTGSTFTLEVILMLAVLSHCVEKLLTFQIHVLLSVTVLCGCVLCSQL